MKVYEFEDIKKRIRPRLLKRDQNLRHLKNAPYIDIKRRNLILVFYVDLGIINGINMGFCISNEHIRDWHITIKELIDAVSAD